VRKGIARVLTVYRANLRSALRTKIAEDAKNKAGKVRCGCCCCCGGDGVIGGGDWLAKLRFCGCMCAHVDALMPLV
jgi:hypothetical protein